MCVDRCVMGRTEVALALFGGEADGAGEVVDDEIDAVGFLDEMGDVLDVLLVELLVAQNVASDVLVHVNLVPCRFDLVPGEDLAHVFRLVDVVAGGLCGRGRAEQAGRAERGKLSRKEGRKLCVRGGRRYALLHGRAVRF